jgi:hypothetical protein
MELASNPVVPVFVLTKSFSRFSAGTKFTIKGQTGGTVSHCETFHPINDDGEIRRVRADIPTNLLTPVRKR